MLFLPNARKLQEVTNEDDFRNLLNSEELSFRFDCGISQPASSLCLADKENIVSSFILHYCIYNCMMELDEIRHGLSSLGFNSLLKKHPSLRSLFFASDTTFTSHFLQSMFSPQFSPMGSNTRASEEASMMLFIELLQKIEGKFSVFSECCVVAIIMLNPGCRF